MVLIEASVMPKCGRSDAYYMFCKSLEVDRASPHGLRLKREGW